MLDLLKSVAGPIIVFGLVIFVHELGHFVAAKLVGVYAPRFSIGFGPALWRRRRGETEYILAALPLGGYVRLASREDEATAFLEGGSEHRPATVGGAGEGKLVDEESISGHRRDYDSDAMVPFGPKPVPEDRWFESKSLPARLFIMLAGVTMNIALALVVMIGVFLVYGRQITPTRVVGAVEAPAGAPALDEQILPGDTILAVGGERVEHWTHFERLLLTGSGSPVVITTQRGDVSVAVGAEGEPTREELVRSIIEFLPPVIGSVIGEPARRAGLEPGDSIVSLGGERITVWYELTDRIARSAGENVQVELVRNGQRRTLTVRPESTVVADQMTGRDSSVVRIGVGPRDISTRESVSVGDAVVAGWRGTWLMSGLILNVLRGLATGEISLSTLAGPVGIVSMSAEAARTGLESLLLLLALLSVNVAIFNLLPIPLLDGGQIVLNVIESVRGRALSARTREYILRAGLLMIALLFVLVMWNDIVRLLRSFG